MKFVFLSCIVWLTTICDCNGQGWRSDHAGHNLPDHHGHSKHVDIHPGGHASIRGGHGGHIEPHTRPRNIPGERTIRNNPVKFIPSNNGQLHHASNRDRPLSHVEHSLIRDIGTVSQTPEINVHSRDGEPSINHVDHIRHGPSGHVGNTNGPLHHLEHSVIHDLGPVGKKPELKVDHLPKSGGRRTHVDHIRNGPLFDVGNTNRPIDHLEHSAIHEIGPVGKKPELKVDHLINSGPRNGDFDHTGSRPSDHRKQNRPLDHFQQLDMKHNTEHGINHVGGNPPELFPITPPSDGHLGVNQIEHALGFRDKKLEKKARRKAKKAHRLIEKERRRAEKARRKAEKARRKAEKRLQKKLRKMKKKKLRAYKKKKNLAYKKKKKSAYKKKKYRAYKKSRKNKQKRKYRRKY